MSHLVSFPWIDRQEVKRVFEELYSGDVKSQKHAIDRIAVWKCRAMSRLPSAVESTAAFVSAMIEDTSCGSTYTETLHLRATYSMAVIRFVNHVTERGQQGPHARPVHIIASEFGVPEWIVELRHSATHGSLPSLSELKAATCWGLKWLKEKFWDIQIAEAHGVSSLRSAALEMMKESLVTYMQRKFQEFSSGGNVSCKQVLTDIEHMLSQLRSEACCVLIEDGYFIFSKEQLDCLGFSLSELQDSKKLLLPPAIVEFWSPVIMLICKADLLATFVLVLASAITEEKSHRNTLLLAWLYTIIWYNNRKQSKKSGTKQLKISEDLPYRTVLEKCAHLCSSELDSLMNILIDKSDLTMLRKQQLREVTKVYKQSNVSEVSPVSVHSVNDLNENSTNISTATCWNKYIGPVEWSLLPFGALPDQQIGYRSLELDYTGSVETENDYNDSDDDMDITESTTDSSLMSNDNLSTDASENEFAFRWDKMTKKAIKNNKNVLF